MSAEHRISAALERYRQGFLHLDAAALASLWDTNHAPLIYIAQEKPDPIRGWEAINAYLRALPDHLVAIDRMDLSSLSLDIRGEVAVACFEFSVAGRLKARPEPHCPTGRVTMLLHEKAGDWRLFHYHESAIAADAVLKGAARA